MRTFLFAQRKCVRRAVVCAIDFSLQKNLSRTRKQCGFFRLEIVVGLTSPPIACNHNQNHAHNQQHAANNANDEPQGRVVYCLTGNRAVWIIGVSRRAATASVSCKSRLTAADAGGGVGRRSSVAVATDSA